MLEKSFHRCRNVFVEEQAQRVDCHQKLKNINVCAPPTNEVTLYKVIHVGKLKQRQQSSGDRIGQVFA